MIKIPLNKKEDCKTRLQKPNITFYRCIYDFLFFSLYISQQLFVIPFLFSFSYCYLSYSERSHIFLFFPSFPFQIIPSSAPFIQESFHSDSLPRIPPH